MELQKPNGGDLRIAAPVVIRELLSNRTYRASLPNGKMILLFESTPEGSAQRSVGDELTAGLSLCDFSVGVIADEASGLVPVVG
jgi:hypothetical protein